MAIQRKPWTRAELATTIALYCQLPFGKLHSRHPAVIALATELERSPSSVALKLVNLASLDPDLQARGIKGMANASALDREVWHEYYGHWQTLAQLFPASLQTITGSSAADDLEIPAGPTEANRAQTVRLGQRFFRNAVLAAYQFKCCITQIATPELLRAGHIVPWAASEEQRLNPKNGLCLNALHDAAFDKGLLTLTADLEVKVSSRLAKTMPAECYNEQFAKYEKHRIALPEKFLPLAESLAYHRKHVYRI